MVAKLLSFALQVRGHDAWMDRQNLSITSAELKKTLESNINKTKVAIVCIGVSDLQRCSNVDDFFRWELDQARRLEAQGKIRVVVVVHGTVEVEDLVCGTVLANKSRERILKSVGQWGEDLLEYLRKHFVIFFDINDLDAIAQKIILELRGIRI